MATKRLGKGLEALIRSNSPDMSEASAKSSGISSVLISKINANPLQPRREFKKELLDDLAASIKENGVIRARGDFMLIICLNSLGISFLHCFIKKSFCSKFSTTTSPRIIPDFISSRAKFTSSRTDKPNRIDFPQF